MPHIPAGVISLLELCSGSARRAHGELSNHSHFAMTKITRAGEPQWNLVLTVLRSALGRSQKDLAAAAGISPNLVSDYECGRRPLLLARLRRLVAALGLDLEAIDDALVFIEKIQGVGMQAPEERSFDKQRQVPGL